MGHGAGRVHAAAISGCNDDAGSVTVEWFENEEMKGKEVDFHGLIVLNGLKAATSTPAPAVVAAPPPQPAASRERRKSPKAVRREVTNPPVQTAPQKVGERARDCSLQGCDAVCGDVRWRRRATAYNRFKPTTQVAVMAVLGWLRPDSLTL